MKAIQKVKELNERELEAVTESSGSWHRDYDDTAFIYIGGLPLELSEGDVVTIFSQFGEPVWIRMPRDKETGRTKGFAWLKYEDRRSCELAIDNLSGAKVMDRFLNVDHARYKKRDDEDMGDNTVSAEERHKMEKDLAQAREKQSKKEVERQRKPMLKEERELMKLIRDADEDDPMAEYMIKQKREEVEKAKRAAASSDRHRTKDRRRDRDEDSEDEARHRRHRRRSRERQSDHPDKKRDGASHSSRRRSSPNRNRSRSRDRSEAGSHSGERHRQSRDRRERSRERDSKRNENGSSRTSRSPHERKRRRDE